VSLYLLDTNIVSDMIKHGEHSSVLDHIARVGTARVITSVIVSGEIIYGVQKKGSIALEKRAKDVLARLPIYGFETPMDQDYGRIRHALSRAGTPIGANDLLIAAQSVSLGATLVTDNEREFSRVPGLVVENWLRV
jgi:tRNA(fMet)-specific endonuclease VapC